MTTQISLFNSELKIVLLNNQMINGQAKQDLPLVYVVVLLYGFDIGNNRTINMFIVVDGGGAVYIFLSVWSIFPLLVILR